MSIILFHCLYLLQVGLNCGPTENYLLHIHQPKYRTAMARLRTSTHSLAIEVGRFHKPRPLPVTDRLCTVCDIIEDEYHFLCVCPQYSLKRQQMETMVDNLFPYYRSMSQEKKFIFLLSHSHPQVNHSVPSFIYHSFVMHNSSGPPWLFSGR